jgi:formylglycine-generating enzyme required for sulfatase activity
MQQADKSLGYGRCIATACDASAKPQANEACVPAGQFTMGGLDGDGGTAGEIDTLPAHAVAIRHRFYIDKYEVSVQEFNTWWNAVPRQMPSDGTLVYVSGAGDLVQWATPSGGLVAPGNQSAAACILSVTPVAQQASINCVAYETALAYCLAQSKRLPTEAEWEYVATQQGAGSLYPWGSAVPDDSCTQTIDAPCNTKTPNTFPTSRPAATAGNTPAALGGVNNLAGNEAEWTLDYAWPFGCAATSTCWPSGMADPLQATSSAFGRIVRGGSYLSDANGVRSRARAYLKTDTQSVTMAGNVGFRCVRDER